MTVDPLVIVPTIVDVGLAACLRAQGDGVDLRLSHVAVGRGLPDGGSWKGYVPSRAQTGLVHEDARVPILTGSKLPQIGFRVLARIPRTTDGSETPVREVGWYLDTGELLCVWSEAAAAPLTYRTPRAEIDLAHELYLAQVPLSVLSITVQQPDIPDALGVHVTMLALSAREATQHADAHTRTLRSLFTGA